MEHTSSFLPAFLQKRQVLSVFSVFTVLLILGVSVVFMHLHSSHAANAFSWSSGNMVGQKSLRPPAMAAFNGKLYVIYVSEDTSAFSSSGELWVTSSSDGITWSINDTFTKQSIWLDVNHNTHISPALAVYNNKLYMAYVAGDGSNALMMASSSDGINWSDGTAVPNQYTHRSPSLAVYNNKLYVAFVADNKSASLLIDSYDGTNWSGDSLVSSSSVSQSSSESPALAAFNNQLYIVFAANNSSRDIIYALYDGTGWSNDTPIGQVTQGSPAMTVFRNELSIAFVDNGNNNHLLYVSSDGTHWPNNIWVPNQYTSNPPAIAVLNNRLYIAYLANDGSDDLFIVSGS
jgi:hypothetical protein